MTAQFQFIIIIIIVIIIRSDYAISPLQFFELKTTKAVTRMCYSLRSGDSSILPALNFHPAEIREPDDLCGNECYRRKLLMMGIMMPETCWA